MNHRVNKAYSYWKLKFDTMEECLHSSGETRDGIGMSRDAKLMDMGSLPWKLRDAFVKIGRSGRLILGQRRNYMRHIPIMKSYIETNKLTLTS